MSTTSPDAFHDVERTDRGASTMQWIIGARPDLLLFLGTPCLLFVVAELALSFGFEVAIIVLGTVGAIGHHFPGLMRAYGDRALFVRQWSRLVIGACVLAIVCSTFIFADLDGLGFIVLMWGVWHAMAQVYGMGRVYDAKVGHLSRQTAYLDKAFCVSWFTTVLLLSPGRIQVALTELYKSGIPAIAPEALSNLQLAAIIATSATTGAWLLHHLDSRKTDRPESLTKVILFSGSIAFWWYANVLVQNVIIGVALFEILHDVQYLGFVWNFKNADLRKAERPARLSAMLFSANPKSLSLFVILAVVYGTAFRGAEQIFSGTAAQVIAILVLLSTLLHFYTDSFIWNLRDAPVRKVLGVDDAERA